MPVKNIYVYIYIYVYNTIICLSHVLDLGGSNLGSPKAAPCLFAHKIVHLCQGTPVSFSNARNGESVYKDQSPQAEPGKRLRWVSKI